MADQDTQALPEQRMFRTARMDGASPALLLNRIFWIAVLACLLWGAIMSIQAMSFDKPRCANVACMFSAPGVELQLSRDGTKFQQIIDQGNRRHNVAVITRNTKMDFVFIFLYCSSFALFALRERHRLTPIVSAAIIIAGIFDVLENRRILAAMGALANNEPVTHLSYPFSIVKWIAFASALFSLALLLRKKAGQIAIPIFLGLSAVLVLIGTVVSFFPQNGGAIMGIAVLLLFVALLITLFKYVPFTLPDVLALIEYAYLLRFQIIAAVILAATLPLGYRLVPSVFTGLFDAGGTRSLVFIVWAAFQLAWTVMITSRLVLRYAPDRFDRAREIKLHHVGAVVLILFGLLAVPSVVSAWMGSLDLSATQKLLATVIGLTLSLLLLIANAALNFFVEQPDGDTAETIFPSFPFIKQFRTGGRTGLWRWIDHWLSTWPADVTAGLLRNNRLRSGHQMSAIFLLLLLVIYGILGFVFSPDLRKPEHLPAALFFLLFVLIILAWLFAGVAFLLDRFRLPVLTTVFALSLATGLVNTDHEFSLATPKVPRTTLSPKNVLDHWAQGRGTDRKTIAIVATAGGGIRAAAWTAQVLTNLQHECGAQDFSHSLVLISSVSGGSVGSMFFLRRYDVTNGDLPDGSLDQIAKDAERSSLSAVGWGMLYPDLARTIPLFGMGVPQTLDRGWALENSWVSGWDNPPTLNQWRNAVAHGTLPAAIFNATAVESGQRFLAATTDVPDRGALRFAERFPDWDLPIATAARLSATFTYVSPAARATDGTPDARVHVVDGGYYDNSGVVSALEWLTNAGDALKDYNVLFILIDADAGAPASGKPWPWQQQITAPVETLANVRSSSQQFRAHFELDLAQAVPGLRLQKPAYFLYRSKTENPLSWHLNKEQIKEIENAWSDKDIATNRDHVFQSLGCHKK